MSAIGIQAATKSGSPQQIAETALRIAEQGTFPAQPACSRRFCPRSGQYAGADQPRRDPEPDRAAFRRARSAAALGKTLFIACMPKSGSSWLIYEAMMADKKAVIAHLSERYDLAKFEAEIEETLAQVEGDQRNNRFNKGVAGRGEEELSVEQKDRVRRLASYSPSVGFERIGL